MPISNKEIIKKKSEFTYPELRQADKVLSKTKNTRDKYVRPGDELSAFGEDLMSDRNFVKELRRLQEKHNLMGLA